MADFNEKKILALLNKTGSIIEKYDTLLRETGGSFNIFEIADIETDERIVCRIVCRILRELLSPKGRHGQGSKYLELFFRDCMDVDIDKEVLDEISDAKVHREYQADGRQIDIVIESANRFIPIEVKIYAGDQPAQCYDYCSFAKNKEKTKSIASALYYITRMGDPPSEDSVNSIDGTDKLKENDEGDQNMYRGVVQLSFSTHIKYWLNNCLKITEKEEKPSVHEIIKQFIISTNNFSNTEESKKMTEIVDTIQNNSEYVKAAAFLKDYIMPELRKVMLRRIADGLISEYNMEPYDGKDTADTLFYFFTKTKDPTMLFQINYQTNNSNAVWAGLMTNIKTSPFTPTGYKIINGKTIHWSDNFYELFEEKNLQDCIKRIYDHYCSI